MSFALELVDEPLNAIPLTAKERTLKTQLEAVVRSGFETFMRVAEALSEIRRRRLYRCDYVDFASYVKAEFGLALSSANGLIRNFEIAQNLMADGVQLAPDTLPTTVKPLAGVPADEGLRTACWQYAQSLSPARTPSSTLVTSPSHSAWSRSPLQNCDDVPENLGNCSRIRTTGAWCG